MPQVNGLRQFPFFGLAVRLAVFALVAVLLAWGLSATNRAEAHFPHPGIDFSISVGTQCDSTAGPAKCTVAIGQPFTLQFKLNSIPQGFTYDGYDSLIAYSGVSPIQTSLVQIGAGVWPMCVFHATNFNIDSHPDEFGVACSYGPDSTPSSYTGVLYRIDFQCPNIPPTNPATISLVHGEGNTSVVEHFFGFTHGEADGRETLTINCVEPVGGVSLDPGAGVQGGSSGGGASALLAIAGATAGAIAMGGAAWYTRRRRARRASR